MLSMGKGTAQFDAVAISGRQCHKICHHTGRVSSRHSATLMAEQRLDAGCVKSLLVTQGEQARSGQVRFVTRRRKSERLSGLQQRNKCPGEGQHAGDWSRIVHDTVCEESEASWCLGVYAAFSRPSACIRSWILP